jgi:hypothetical protein
MDQIKKVISQLMLSLLNLKQNVVFYFKQLPVYNNNCDLK